jgi:hypothetical protein
MRRVSSEKKPAPTHRFRDERAQGCNRLFEGRASRQLRARLWAKPQRKPHPKTDHPANRPRAHRATPARSSGSASQSALKRGQILAHASHRPVRRCTEAPRTDSKPAERIDSLERSQRRRRNAVAAKPRGSHRIRRRTRNQAAAQFRRTARLRSDTLPRGLRGRHARRPTRSECRSVRHSSNKSCITSCWP